MESHKRKTISGGHYHSEPENKKLNIKQIQDGNAKRRYDITVNNNTVGLPTVEKDDNPYLKTWNRLGSSITEMETDICFDNKEVFPVKKEHNQLFVGKKNAKSLLDSYKGGTGKTKKENKPTILFAKCGSPKKSNMNDVLCERPILNYEDIVYDDEDKLHQNMINDSKYQKSFKSTKPIKNDTRTNESVTFILQQNNISIRKDNLYFCETCNVQLEPGNEYLYKHIKTKPHCRFLADNMHQYFSMRKQFSEKQLFFHGLYELRCDLFYCKRCDFILDATDRSSITKHSLSIDHNYALCQHLEKLYDDNKLSMKLEHNMSSEKCKEFHCNLVPTFEEDDDILGKDFAAPENENFVGMDSGASQIENMLADFDASEIESTLEMDFAASKNGNVTFNNAKFNQHTIKGTQSQKYMNKSRPEFSIPTSSKAKINDRRVNIVSTKNTDLNLHSDLTEKLLEKNGTQPQKIMNKYPLAIGVPTSSNPKLNDKRGELVTSNNSDVRTNQTEKLLKNLIIGLPEPEKKDQQGFANDVAVKKFLDIKGMQAVKDQSIVQDGVFDENQTELNYKLPELEPIILNKSSIALSDNDRIRSKSLLVTQRQKFNLKHFINGS